MHFAHLSVPLHPDMQKQKKILFLHGFYASGSCVPALALKEAFNKKATVLTPDLPLHPADAVRLIREAHQFDCCNIYNKVRVWGIFGEEDTLAHFEPLFLEHYHSTFHFPGGHTPTAEQFKTWYCPLIEKLMLEYPISEDRLAYIPR